MCTRLRCEDRVSASVRLCTHDDCVRPCCVLLRGWHSTKCNRFIDQCATPAGEASTTTTSEVPTSNYTIFQQPPSSSASKPKGAMATAANKPSTTTGPTWPGHIIGALRYPANQIPAYHAPATTPAAPFLCESTRPAQGQRARTMRPSSPWWRSPRQPARRGVGPSDRRRERRSSWRPGRSLRSTDLART